MDKRQYITEEEAERFYEECATPEHVILHCRAVTAVAVKLAEALNESGASLDVELIRGAGMLHDLERTHQDHQHVGAVFVRTHGYPQEADIIEAHMTHAFPAEVGELTELDMVCMGDRLVLEDAYAGLDKRMDYVIRKMRARLMEQPDGAEAAAQAEKRITERKQETKKLLAQIEDTIGKSIDELMGRYPDRISEQVLNRLLQRVEKPARYTGGELYSAVKDPDAVGVRFAFAFPDTYEIGMSYLGMQILYDILNRDDRIYCERTFAPGDDMEALMRQNGVPLFTLETKTPVKHCDFFGFTLQYEMCYTNVINMLELSGIPLLSADRGSDSPIVIAGGPCAFNPEPLADMIDIFLIGDGEENLKALLLEYEAFRKSAIFAINGRARIEFLKQACRLPGVYVPAFYEHEYNEDGTISRIRRSYEGAPEKVQKAMIRDLEHAPFPVRPIVPFIETVHDRSIVETFRGCTRGCRFCQAGVIYRPVRERSTECIVATAMEQLKNTGHEELSLLSLSTSDHSEFEPLALTLMKECRMQNVSLSLPSLRLDSFSFKVLEEIQGYKKSGLTFAPEAGSQRLRDVINKGINEKDIYGAVEQALELGWNNMKLYFMVGLPYETEEDLEGIAEIARRIVDLNFKIKGEKSGRFNVTVSVSNFVPKPFTPFQWVGQDSKERFSEKHRFLKERLKKRCITFRYHETDTSVMEAVLARGDRRLGAVLRTAHQLGCKFDAWGERFCNEKWQQAFESCGIAPAFYAERQRSYDEILPWDTIDCMVTKAYLQEENEKAKQAAITPDCRKSCNGCGLQSVCAGLKTARQQKEEQGQREAEGNTALSQKLEAGAKRGGTSTK